MKSAAFIAGLIALFGIVGTPDYILELERENFALRAKVAALSRDAALAGIRADVCEESGLVQAHRVVARAE